MRVLCIVLAAAVAALVGAVGSESLRGADAKPQPRKAVPAARWEYAILHIADNDLNGTSLVLVTPAGVVDSKKDAAAFAKLVEPGGAEQREATDVVLKMGAPGGSEIYATLSALGQDGWELVAVDPTTYYFKRPAR